MDIIIIMGVFMLLVMMKRGYGNGHYYYHGCFYAPCHVISMMDCEK